MLELLGYRRHSSAQEQVAILVGPNGAGKSNFLKGVAEDLRHYRNLLVACNTAYDRFSGMRGIKRISASRAGRSPKGVVKLAVAHTLGEDDGRFYQIGKILDYCGYRPSIGFRIEGTRKHLDPRDLIDEGFSHDDAELIISFFERFDPREIIWVGDRGSVLGYSRSLEFSRVLRLEAELRKGKHLRDIQVYLERNDGTVIELLRASSGELALISSLMFLSANRDEDPVILIDEPENSLHPSWQREYVDKLLNALEYRNATVLIATHAPLVVTGALSRFGNIVSVFAVDRGSVERLPISGSDTSSESIEAILWRAFDVITPASHFVSEELVGVVQQVEAGELSRDEALAQVQAMQAQSFDSRQQAFLEGVNALIDKVDVQRRAEQADEDEDDDG